MFEFSENTSLDADGEILRSIEQARVMALVERNIERAALLHAPDFQLITPVGIALFKEQYLGAIAAGGIIYSSWEPQHIDVRLYNQAAAIRYKSSLEVTFGSHHVPRAEYWHTDLYEKRNGLWQVVWSQATEIRHQA
ncbi:nuclear transport factor 2 family protein [Massilia sp. erpn]|uniref:nuclear transport factor 2 family protein n=1 Tax=Massilia sp. erpn TaxID=2738142 RepID=UPI00210634BC|nr:nuclear transport factor 2 family protein [Massilia sp. erpn]UTY59600.1 nuclear transport factor 2 family protein [Massilia sp. erpn]